MAKAIGIDLGTTNGHHSCRPLDLLAGLRPRSYEHLTKKE